MIVSKCIGILGRLFGHKFTHMDGWIFNECQRCGMPKGGWKS